MGSLWGARFEVDTPAPVRLSRSEYYIAGWFTPAQDSGIHQRLVLEVDGVRLPVSLGLRRNDVAEHLGSPSAADSGFIARFQAPRISPRIRLFFEDVEKRHAVAEFVVPVSSPPRPRTHGGISDYHHWIINVEPNLFHPRDHIHAHLARLPYRPLISIIVVPAETLNTYLFNRCLISVLEQHYSHLEVHACIPSCGHIQPQDHLDQRILTDLRFTITERTLFDQIGSCVADVLRVVQGDYLIWMRDDDELHPHALVELVDHLNRRPQAAFLYSDEDHIDVYGNRSKPVAKPEFDREMLVSCNYIGYLACIRRDTLAGCGDLRTLSERAEYWDLLLRSTDQHDENSISHVPKVLYHRRVYDTSTSIESRNASDPQATNIRLITNYLKNTNRPGTAGPGIGRSTVRIRFPYPSDVRAGVFVRTQDGPFQISLLSQQPERESIQFYEITGCAVRPVTSQCLSGLELPLSAPDSPPEDVLIFINESLESVNHFFLNELLGQAMRPECGLVTGLSLDLTRAILHAGFVARHDGTVYDPFAGQPFANHLNVVRTVDSISDYFFAVRREIFLAAGGLASISESHMSRLVRRIAMETKTRTLRVIVTPYAIATFECSPSDSDVARVNPDRLQPASSAHQISS
ncbi:MAG: hypothetical protein JO061_14745 [Acidobacteriaceae bacterium]|nr:hypothetical protein [Acidobacteriaceae bacterium]